MNDELPLGVTPNLLMLERGRGELLLSDYANIQPLYVRKGRKYIGNFLKAVSELGSYKKVLRSFPHEAALLDTLMDHGIVVRTGLREPAERSRWPSEMPCEDSPRCISLYLLISQSCNMSCIYCLNGARTYKKNDNLRMSREVALTSVERCLGSLLYGGILEVIFFGGEPFLNWPLAKEVITYCEEELRGKHPDKEFRYHFTSNLTFLPKDLIEWAHKFNITFLCDVDGPEEIHDKCRPFKRNKPSHAVIVKNIDRLTRSGIEVCLRATVTSANHDRLLEITQHHKEIGGKSSAFVPVNPVNSDEDILSEAMLPSPGKIMEGMRKVYKSRLWEDELLYPFNQYVPRLRPGGRAVHGCGAPYGGTPVIDTGGNAYPCIYLVGIERFHMGNVMDESYPNRNLVRWMRDYLHVDNREDCKSCPWRYVCGGGCALGLLTVVHNPKASAKVKDYYRLIRCEYTKKMLELMLWDRAERAASSALESNFAEPVAANRIHC